MRSALLATLGSEPQVVTAALDLLLARGELISTVAVIHTNLEASPRPIDVLQQAFSALDIPLTLIPITDISRQPIRDLDSPFAVQAAFRCLYQSLRDLKASSPRVHVCIAGGRKTLALFAMAAAQMLCDENDCLWHLHSSGDFLASKRLHPQPGDQVHLIPLPLILWSQISPLLTDIHRLDDPFQAVERIRQMQLDHRIEQARAFVLGSLTHAERRVAELLVREGLSDSEIGARLGLSPRTVEQHLRSAYHKAAAHWELEDVNRGQLIALLSLYYTLLPEGSLE